VSGNPSGRPKGSLNVATTLTKALREKIVINEHGRRRRITKLEAAVKQLVNKAAGGDLRAVRHLTELASDAEANQKSTGVATSELNDMDFEVMNGILKRFQSTEEAAQNSEEGSNDNDQRG
jgi:replication-associated recombination protein RarA